MGHVLQPRLRLDVAPASTRLLQVIVYAVVRYEADVAVSEDVVTRYPIHLLEGLLIAKPPPGEAVSPGEEKTVHMEPAVLEANRIPQHVTWRIRVPHVCGALPPAWPKVGGRAGPRWAASFVPLRLQLVGVSRCVHRVAQGASTHGTCLQVAPLDMSVARC